LINPFVLAITVQRGAHLPLSLFPLLRLSSSSLKTTFTTVRASMDPHDRPFDQLARSESPTSSPSLHAILGSPASRLAHARALLYLPHPQAQSEAEDTAHPLAVFLFLLDCLRFLGGEGTSGGRKGVGRGRMVKNEARVDGDKVTIHGGKGGKEDDMGISEGRREDKEVLLGPGIDDQRRSASKGCAGEVEQGEQRRGKGVEANDGRSDWIEYVREMASL
jgi:hypothetical protein